MSACNFLAPNGQPSLLYAALEQKHGEDIATRMWYAMKAGQLSLFPEENEQEPSPEKVEAAFSQVIKTGNPASSEDPGGPKKPTTVELTPDMFGTGSEAVAKRIKDLYDQAARNPDKIYKVPFKRNSPGFGKKGSKISMSQLAEMFLAHPVPENIQFDPTFEGLMSVAPTRILNDLIITPPLLIPVDPVAMEKAKETFLLKVRDENGVPTGGFFDYNKQNDAIDTITRMVYQRILKQPNQSQFDVADIKNSVKQTLNTILSHYKQIAAGKTFKGFENVTKDEAAAWAEGVQQIINVFDPPGDNNTLWNFTIEKLKLYGLNLYATEGENDESLTALVSSEDGTALRDYRDESFELNRKDTASSRIKFFLSSIELASERKVISMSFSSALSRDAILSGTKKITVRDASQMKKFNMRIGDSAIFTIEGRKVKATFKALVAPGTEETYGDDVADEGYTPKEGDMVFELDATKLSSDLEFSRNHIGLPKLMNFEDTYQKLMALLADQEPSLANYMSLMTQSGDPIIRRVAERLHAEKDHVKNEFVAVMSNQYQEFGVVLTNQVKGVDKITRIQSRAIKANFSSQVDMMLKNWKEAQKAAPITEHIEGGGLAISSSVAADLNISLRVHLAKYQDLSVVDENIAKEAVASGKALLKKLLEVNGLELPDTFYNNFIKNIDKYTKGTKMQGGFLRQFQFSKDDRPVGIVSAMIARLSGALESEEDPEVSNSYELNNPMYTETTSTSIIARAALPYIDMVYSNTHRSATGKSIYDHGLHSALSHKVRRIKTMETERLKKLDTYINEHNALLKALHTNVELRSNFGIMYADAIKLEYLKGNTGTDRSSMSLREQLVFSFGLFEKRGSAKYADYISLTHSDKKTTPIFINAPRIEAVTTAVPSFNGMTSVFKINNEVYRAMYDVFIDEYNRVTKTTESYNADRFDKGKKFFYAMPEFNLKNMKKLLKDNVITKAEFNAIWTDLDQLKPINTEEAKHVLKKLFDRRINNMTDNLLQKWRDNEMLTSTGLPFSLKYMNRLFRNVDIRYDIQTQSYVNSSNAVMDPKSVTETAALLAARDYTVNHFLFNVNVSRLFMGDPAEAFKKDVPTTLIEYAKRLAKDIAPGKDGEWAHSPSYRTVTVEDIEGAADEVKDLILSYGEEVNATDAQEFITVREFLDNKLAIGQIPRDIYNEMIDIITANEGKYYEFTEDRHKIIMQPQKPVYVGEGENINHVILTHYVKSSAIPLLPKFTRGKQLDDIRRLMEVTKVARLNFKSAKKLGTPAKMVKLFDEKGNVDTKHFMNPVEWEGAVQTLDRSGFRLQQEIPYGEDKTKINIVSQMDKLIVQGITQINTPFIFKGEEVSPQALIDAKVNIRKKLLDLYKKDVLADLGVKENELDLHTLYDTLAREAMDRPGYSVNDLESLNYRNTDGSLKMSLLLSPSRARFEALLMNKISSMVNIKMFGRSFVQASSAGIRTHRNFENLTAEEKANIIWAGDYNGGDLQTLREAPDGTIKPAQVLLPFNFFHKGKRINVKKFITVGEDGISRIDPAKLPPEFLQLVGARIPNQGHNSMLPIEVVGFLPEEMGDMIVVPAAITKQMGSDFDVDKLYVYQRPYKYSKGEFSKHDGYEEQLLENYFEIHWSILTHPEMRKKILSPLDKPDMKLEARKADEAAGEIDFFDVTYQIEAYESQKYAKQLVGFSSLSLTSNAIFEQLDVDLATRVWDEVNEDYRYIPFSLSFVDADNQVHEMGTLSGTAESTNHDVNGEKRTKSDNIVIMQSAFLDNAKEPISAQINLNLFTYNAASALMRLQTKNGVAVGIPELAALLRQPAIRQYVTIVSMGSDSFSEGNEDKHELAMQMTRLKYTSKTPIKGPAEINLKEMRDNLENPDPGKQLEYLYLFDMLWKIGKQLGDIQSAFNWDVNGAGPSALQAMNKETIIEDAQGATPLPGGVVIRGLDQLETTQQGYYRRELLDLVREVAFQVFPYDTLNEEVEHYKEITGKQATPTLIETMAESFAAYNWAMASVWGTSAHAERVRLMMSGDHGASLARRVEVAKRTWGRKNYLIQRLDTTINTNGIGPDLVNYALGLSSKYDSAEIARAWTNILNDDKHKDFAQDLIRYTILTGNNSALARHVPLSFIMHSPLYTTVQERLNVIKGSAISTNSGVPFLTQFLQHYPQYAPSLSSNLAETGKSYEVYPEKFELPPLGVEQETAATKLIIRGPDGPMYPNFLHYRDKQTSTSVLYKRISTNVYTRIDTLGTKQLDEYSPEATSIFTENKRFNTATGLDLSKLPEKGGMEEMHQILDSIARDPKVPSLYRQLAKLLKIKPRSPLEVNILEGADVHISPLTWQFSNELKGLAGQYNPFENKININRKIDPADLPETLIHELIHYHTSVSLGVFGVKKNLRYHAGRHTSESLAKLQAMSEQLEMLMPEAAAAASAIDKVRKEALDIFKAEYRGTDFDKLYEMVVSNQISPSLSNDQKRAIRFIYAFASNQEFVSHIFTDRDVMLWLNRHQTSAKQPQSLWERLKELIATLLESIKSFIGEDVVQGSLLKEGIHRAMEYMYAHHTIPQNPILGISDINPDAMTLGKIDLGTATTSSENKKIQAIIARLEDQKREIAATFTGVVSKKVAAQKTKQLDDLQTQIDKLKNEQDLKDISEVGKAQLKWVTEVANNDNATDNEVVVADRILELWTNLMDVMYGDNVNTARTDPEWGQIASEAQKLRSVLLQKSTDLLIKHSDGLLTRSDFNSQNLTDVGWAAIRVRGMSSAAEGKALQYISTYMEQTDRMVTEAVNRMLVETRQLEKDFIAYAGGKKNVQAVYAKLLQENKNKTAWGLVRKYSGSWYAFLNDAKTKRIHRLDVISRDKSASAKDRAAMAKIAWQDYYDKIKRNAAMVDTRKFFDDSGEIRNNPKALADLEKLLGEDPTAVLKKAQERYKQYLEERDTLKDMLEADVKNGLKQRDEADSALQDFVNRYSPNVFFNNFEGGILPFQINTSDRFVVFVPQAKHTKFFDEKHKAIREDAKLYELYNRLHDTLNRFRSYLPKTVQYSLGENFLPVVQQSLVRDISSVPEYVRNMPRAFVDSLTASEWEEGQKGTERIPIQYINNSEVKDPEEIANRSRDLVKITEIFGAMALHYRHFAAAKDVIDMGQSIIREIDRTRSRDGKTVDADGKVISNAQGLKNALDGLQYMKEFMVYKRGKMLEGNSKQKIYSPNLLKNKRTADKVHALLVEKEDIENKFKDGEIQLDEYIDRLENVDRQLRMFDGRTIYGSKVGDKLISIAQAKALSFNPISGVANFSFGLVSAAVFANGRQEFDMKHFTIGFRTMLSATKKWLSFGSYKTDLSLKIMNTMDRLGAMGDVVDSQYGKLEDRQRIPNWKKTVNPYSWLRSGDYFVRGLNMVAMLSKEQVTVTENGEQKTISLWEALDKNGNWDESRFGKNPEWTSDNLEEQKHLAKTRDKLARVNMIIMGNVDKSSPKMANKWIIGRLIGQFRLSWLPEGWYSRWSGEKYDIQLGRNVKGRYTTYADMGLGTSLKVLGRQYASLLTKLDPFTGVNKSNGKPISEADIANMRRNFAELNFYLLLMGAILIAKGMMDDEEESEAIQLLTNLAIRTRQDLTFFASPEVFDNVTRSLIPAFSVIKDYSKFVDASWKVMTDDDYTAEEWLLKATKAGLPIPQATLVNKMKYMTERSLDDISR